MGKKNYKRTDISDSKTAILDIDSLLVLKNDNTDDHCFNAVHKQYFSKKKNICPACHSNKTRSSKVTIRKFKDIIECDDNFQIIDLFFHQRWFRCDNCKSSVFSEDIDFAEKGCRYTNRLADKLANGTFNYSYKKVCDYYGVHDSTASVGAIMRRQIKYRESCLPILDTPNTIVIIELDYFKNRYPIIIGIRALEIYCLDLLPDTSEATYITFFRNLDAKKLENIYVEPNDELKSAVAACFPTLPPLISQECISRHARNAFIEIIHSDGKRFPLVNKEDKLTQNKKYITSSHDKKQIKLGMSSRKRLKRAYEHYQSLLKIFEDTWDYTQLLEWADKIESDLCEYGDLIDIIEFYETEINNALTSTEKLPQIFSTVVRGICDAINAMPHCIFDILRARCMLTISNDTIKENDEQKRCGILADRFVENITKITNNIKENRDYGNEFK